MYRKKEIRMQNGHRNQISITGHQKMQIKIKMRYSYPHLNGLKRTKQDFKGEKKTLTILSIDEDAKHLELSHTLLLRIQMI